MAERRSIRSMALMNTKRLFHPVLLLVALLMVFQARAEPAPSDESTGIEGQITVSPIHPGPTKIDAPNSGPLPNAEFVVQDQNGPIKSFTTDEQGKFRVLLPAGHYTIAPKSGRRTIGRFGPFEVDVAPGKMTQVSWTCDSGIR